MAYAPINYPYLSTSAMRSFERLAVASIISNFFFLIFTNNFQTNECSGAKKLVTPKIVSGRVVKTSIFLSNFQFQM